MHEVGRCMLGLADDFAYQAQPEGKVIVQPSFEITSLGPAPRAEALVGRLAERTGSRTGTMFRITRASTLAAAAAGMTADDAWRDLSEISDKPVPANVKHEVQSWFNATRRVKMRQTWVIDAGDQATCTRILAALGKKARQITPEPIEMAATKKGHSTLIRKLKAAGIFVRSFARDRLILTQPWRPSRCSLTRPGALPGARRQSGTGYGCPREGAGRTTAAGVTSFAVGQR